MCFNAGAVEVGRVRSVASVFDRKDMSGGIDSLSISSGNVMRSSILDASSFLLVCNF